MTQTTLEDKTYTATEIFPPRPSAEHLPEPVYMGSQPLMNADDRLVVDINQAILSGAISEDRVHSLLNIKQRIIDERNKELAFEAFALMQAKILPIVRDSKTTGTGNYAFDYASPDAIAEEIGPLLGEYGFFITHRIEQPGDNNLRIFTELTHKKGYKFKTDMLLPHDTSGGKNAVQAIGSSQTYGMKYNNIGLLNLATKKDDDADKTNKTPGNNGGGSNGPVGSLPKPSPAVAAQGPKLNDDQIQALDEACSQLGIQARTQFLNWAGVQSIADIFDSNYEKCKGALVNLGNRLNPPVKIEFGAKK